MLDSLLRPIRSVLGQAEREVTAPVAGTERELVDAASAIERSAESIEHHVEALEGLATSIAPLTESVDRLTAAVTELVTLLAPVAKAEHGVERVEHLFGRHRQEQPGAPEEQPPDS